MKEFLINSLLLAHYDPNKPVRLAVDVSSYGLGAVLSHVQMPVKKNQSRMHPAVSQQVSKIILRSRTKPWQLCFALRNSIRTFLENVFHCLRTTDLSPCCLVPNVVFLCWPRLACSVGLFSYSPIRMTLNTKLSRIILTLTHCLVCHERLCKSRMIGASKLIQVNRVQMERAPITVSQIGEATRGDPVFSRARCCILPGWPAEKLHSRRAKDLLQ